MTRTSTWTYPWDVADMGVDRVVGSLAESGVSALSVAINYHAVSTFAPPNEQRPIFYTTRGGVYFPTRRRRYSGIEAPEAIEPEVAAVHEELRKRTAAEGMELWAWVIGRFQPWVVESYPSTGVVDALGGRPRAQPCASNEEFERFLVEMIDDYLSQFAPDRIQLESPGYPGFAAGWVRERVLHPLPGPVRVAMGWCFCGSCVERLESEGHDAGKALHDVNGFIRSSFRESMPGEEAAVPWLSEIADMRRHVIRGLLEKVASTARNHGALFDCEGALPFGPPSGLDSMDVLEICDGIVLPNPSHQPDDATAVADQLAESPEEADLIVTLEGGDYLAETREGRATLLRETAAYAPDIVAIYNYGLLSHEAFHEIARWSGARTEEQASLGDGGANLE